MTLADNSTSSGAPRRRPNSIRSREMRERIIAATVSCIRTQGYARTTISEVAHTASVSSGALQHHFRNKNELVLAVLEHTFSEVHGFLGAVRVNTGDLRPRIDAIVDEYWRGFGTPNYLTAWEIIIAEKANESLKSAILKNSDLATRAAFALWRDVFSDLDIDEDDLFRILVVTLSNLRGLAFLQYLRDEDFDYSQEVAILKRSLQQQIEDARGRRAS